MWSNPKKTVCEASSALVAGLFSGKISFGIIDKNLIMFKPRVLKSS